MFYTRDHNWYYYQLRRPCLCRSLQTVICSILYACWHFRKASIDKMNNRRRIFANAGLWFIGGLCFWIAISAGCGQKNQPASGGKRELTVAAAADLKFALEDIIAAFEKEQPSIKVAATYGSSGSFFAQLSNKAPFDIFLSADIDYPRKLIEQLCDQGVGVQLCRWANSGLGRQLIVFGCEKTWHPGAARSVGAPPSGHRQSQTCSLRPGGRGGHEKIGRLRTGE